MTPEGLGWTLHASGMLAARIRFLHMQAIANNEGHEFIEALKFITSRIETGPLDYGEPLYRLPALKLLICVQVRRPVVVEYGVHDELPLVFLRDVRSI